VSIERLAIDHVDWTHFLEVLEPRRTIHPGAANEPEAERRCHPLALPASLVTSLFDFQRLKRATKAAGQQAPQFATFLFRLELPKSRRRNGSVIEVTFSEPFTLSRPPAMAS